MQIGHSLGVNNTKVRGQATIPMAIKNILKKYNATLLLPGASGNLVQIFQPGNYVESTGQTLAPVDSAVGFVADAAGTFGPELASSFDSAGWWSLGAGWSISSGVAAHSSAAGAGSIQRANLLTVGKWYVVEFDRVDSGISSANVVLGNNYLSSSGGVGRKRSIGQATVNTWFGIQGGADYQISNISVREITGIHATQATTQYKPSVRRGLVNLLTYSNDFSNAAWALLGAATRSIVAGASPTGGSVTRLQSGAISQGIRQYQTTIAGEYTGAFYLKSNTGSPQTVALRYFNNTTQFIRHVVLTSEWQLFTEPNTATAGSNFQFDIMSSATTPVMDILIAGCGLFQGTLTAQQIIDAGGIPVTTSAPASSTRGSNYWQFDGTDDRLQLSQVPFQMSDDHFVVAGFNMTSPGRVAVIPGSNASGHRVAALITDGSTGKARASWWDGSNHNVISSPSSVIGLPSVLSAAKSGASGRARLDGSPIGTTTISASFTADVAFVGWSFGGAYQMAGLIHAVIFGKGAITDAELLTLEKFVAKLQGRQL